jgi:prolyl-tRNA synthetase
MMVRGGGVTSACCIETSAPRLASFATLATAAGRCTLGPQLIWITDSGRRPLLLGKVMPERIGPPVRRLLLRATVSLLSSSINI